MAHKGSSRQPNSEVKKFSGELFSLTYGALVAQLIQDFEEDEEVNKQLEKLGYNIGVRLVEDFLARTGVKRCHDFKETADTLVKAFQMYLGVQPALANWSLAADEFSFIFESSPVTDFVELPEEHRSLRYSNLVCGALRGALEMVYMEVTVSIVRDSLLDDDATEVRLHFIRRLEDAIPDSED